MLAAKVRLMVLCGVAGLAGCGPAPPAPEPWLSVGTTVQLPGFSQRMVVNKYVPDGGVECVWFSKEGYVRREVFSRHIVRVVNEADKDEK